MNNSINSSINFNSIKSNESNYLAHGTTFGALYLMSRLKGENHNSLISYGDLDKQKIPVFSGECFRGIADNGVNRDKTSWNAMSGLGECLSYAEKFPFSIEEVKSYLIDIIKDNEIYKKVIEKEKEENTHVFELSRPRFAMEFNTSYWNKIKLRIRQLRAWDESIFQEFKEGLISWMNEEIAFMHRPILKNPTHLPHYKILQSLLEEVQNPTVFQLNEEEKENLLKTYPIILFTNSDNVTFENIKELGITKKLKLGEDIQTIATAPEFMDAIQMHLRQQGLEMKVSLISFAVLGIN